MLPLKTISKVATGKYVDRQKISQAKEKEIEVIDLKVPEIDE